jgi:hypothetical protein
MRRALALLSFLLVGACADLSKDQTVCPEYRSLRCPAGSSCSFDQERSCRVCQCNAVNQMGPVSSPDQNVPPSVVLPQR